LGEFAVLFDVAGGVGAQPETGQNKKEAAGHGGGNGSAARQLKEIEAGSKEAEGHADAACDALPPLRGGEFWRSDWAGHQAFSSARTC
jgi:hypothetical protein